MNLDERIKAFSDLGEILRNTIEGKGENQLNNLTDLINNQVKYNQLLLSMSGWQ